MDHNLSKDLVEAVEQDILRSKFFKESKLNNINVMGFYFVLGTYITKTIEKKLNNYKNYTNINTGRIKDLNIFGDVLKRIAKRS